MTLEQQLSQCEADTRRILGAAAANRLARWRQHDSEQALIDFVRRAINRPENRTNAFDIHRQGGLSLEQIVINHPALFTTDDMIIARRTLGQN